MPDLLVVAGWRERYETHETRKLKHLLWLALPNRMDTVGYLELMDHPDCAAHLGVWVALLEIASRCDPRGELKTQGRPMTCLDIGRISRIPPAVIEAAVPRLVELGWLRNLNVEGLADPDVEAQQNQQTGDGRENLPLCRENPPDEGKGIEGNGREVERESAREGDGLPGWDEFVAAYPEPKRGVGVELACQAYVGRISIHIDGRPLRESPEHGRLMAGLRRWLASENWVRSLRDDKGRYVPTMAKFITAGTYLDHPPAAQLEPKTRKLNIYRAPTLEDGR